METARQLVQQGAHAMLGCRRVAAGEEAAKDVPDTGSYEVMKIDLGDLQLFVNVQNWFL